MIWLRLHHRGLVVVDDGVGQLGGGEDDVGLATRPGWGVRVGVSGRGRVGVGVGVKVRVRGGEG